ncbi:zinc finger (C3HC4 RING finger) protein, putative [Eimeria brunetti]|uniref:RING-type E3 ubiquitin transferase n=1 Tax=Eimeria brunetti TaxID=51314 RepID=U6LSV2_9EIME|nr:zinc finger (C3HC4 RING finger) protein, putative [Eimeria brunetti]
MLTGAIGTGGNTRGDSLLSPLLGYRCGVCDPLLHICTHIENEALLESRESSLLPSLSLEGVLGGVTSLLGGSPQQQQREGLGFRDSSSSSSSSSSRMRSQTPTISLNRCCPICMVDLNNEDIVLIMPCDPRHYFHRACVEHWLETSQACPICRANIVHLLMGTGDAQQNAERGTAIEMQV